MVGKSYAADVIPLQRRVEAEEPSGAKPAHGSSDKLPGEALFLQMAESFNGVGFSLLSPAGTVLAWNNGATELERRSAAEVVGRSFSSIFTVEELERGEPERRLRAASGTGRFEEEGWRTRGDGSTYWAMVTITALRSPEGELNGYLLVMRDLSEKRAEAEALRSAYERLNSMMNATSDGILQLSHEWTILYGNRRAKELSSEFEIGGNFWESFPSLIGTPIADSLTHCMTERETVIYENHFAPTDLWFRARAYPTDEGIGLFFTDITTEKTMQNKLALDQILREKRIEALSQMAGGLAHEINNPLAIIHARASDLEAAVTGKREVPAEEVLRVCQSIVKTCDRATRVLRALQGFAREAGADPMLPASPEELLHQCTELLENRFHRHGVALCVDLERELPLLICRETQIRQIVTNLLNNALDAIEQGQSPVRWVSLTAKREGGVLCVAVCDSGPGIEEKFRAHLMDPFFTAKVRGMGMGVGLSLSRTIAQEHGGTLVLVETGRETCFELRLPFAAEGGPGA